MPLVNLKDMLRHARTHGYAVGAYQAVDSNFISAILAGADAADAPVIVSLAEPHFGHYDFPALAAAALTAARRARVPVALLFDHGSGVDTAVAAIRHGCNGVMADASQLDFEGNVAATRAVVAMAHAVGVPVEGELGYVPGVEGDEAQRHPGAMRYTSAEEAARYVDATGVDFLAVAIGTVHGRLCCEPRLDLDRLAAIAEAVAVPLVIHGGSGLADDHYRGLVERGVAKINYYTALSDLAAAAASDALAAIDASFTAATDAIRAAIGDEVARTCALFGAAGRAAAASAVCRPWQEVEHLIQFNWSPSAAGREAEFEAAGKQVLAAVPGVRNVALGSALQPGARYRRAWFIRFASAAAEAAYMADAAHLAYADDMFRPHAPERLKTDYLLD